MIRKLAFASLSVLLLASPVVASADMVSDLQAQIQSILAKLQQLQTESVVTPSPTFTASPISGLAPLSVVFQQRTAALAGTFAVDFGDGTGFGTMTCTPLAGPTDSLCRVTHAYTMPGVYSAQLIGKGAGNSSEWQGTGKWVTFTVYKPTAGSAFATIDQKSLTTNSANPTLSGTVQNADIEVRIKKGRVTVPSPIDKASQDYVWRYSGGFLVVGGRWSATVADAGVKLENGTYTVIISDARIALVLATGVLLVDTSR
ncbi:hypothetical protein HY971_01150 [Candidatus Kaiserbacteria bacterium]|nr:hypothetical protein [Candidatus Kaiserbacteria bacterium]